MTSARAESSLIRPSFVIAFIIKPLAAYREWESIMNMATDDIIIPVSVML